MIFLILFMIAMFTSPLQGEQWSQKRLDEGDRMLTSVTNKAIDEFESKYHLRCYGRGVAAFGGPIQSIGLDFQTNEPWTKEELRKLLITCATRVVKLIQETPGMEDYLAHPPFTLKNFSIAIFLRSPDWRNVYAPTAIPAKHFLEAK